MLCKRALILAVVSLFMASSLMATTTPYSSATFQNMNRIPLLFTQNMGQRDERVLFRANAGGATKWSTKEGETCQFAHYIANPVKAALAAARENSQNAATTGDREDRLHDPVNRFSLRGIE